MYVHKQLGIIIVFFTFLLLILSTFTFEIFFQNDVIQVNDYSLRANFKDYIKKYNKNYSDDEYEQRLKNFKNSLLEIDTLNKNISTPVYGITKFSDMSKEEFADQMLLKNKFDACTIEKHNCPRPAIKKRNLTDSLLEVFDWRDKGVIGPVLDQKMCPVCWAFSVAGVMESMAAIDGQPLERLSIQELIDCSDGRRGCHYGNPVTTLDYLCFMDQDVVLEKEYPLTLATEECKVRRTAKGRGIASFNVDCFVSNSDLPVIIQTHGPVIALINPLPLQNYVQGVIEINCDNNWNQLRHVVQIVGYNMHSEISDKIPYHYIVKNSWGTDFGEQGYVRIAMYNNICGIQSQIISLDVA